MPARAADMIHRPLVSVVVAVHDGERYLPPALESVFRQTLSDLELVVVDDGSRDRTQEILAGIGDTRLTVVRNEERLGLGAALNCGLDAARGRYIGRLDADDVAFPRWLELQLARLQSAGLAVVGSSALEMDEEGRTGSLLQMPTGRLAVRWAALFSSPFYHSALLLDAQVLRAHGLRYDAEYLESEDYDLWTRLLAVGDGDNLPEPLFLYRLHAAQASRRREGLQRSFQLEIALREIDRVAPDLPPEEVELAFLVGSDGSLGAESVESAARGYLELLSAFERRYGEDRAVRNAASRALVRAALRVRRRERVRILRHALELDRSVFLKGVASRARRRLRARRARFEVEPLLRAIPLPENATRPIRVTAVFPEPTPYRSPLLDRIARRPEVDLTVVYAARTVADRTWTVEPAHPAVFLEGMRIPGLRRALRHDYPLTPGVFRALRDARPEVVVANGWSTFPAQAAIAWSRAHRIPYLLLASSHDAVERPLWRRAVRRPVVAPIVRGAWGAFALGTLSRASLIEHGARPDRVRLFANTIDVTAVGEAADRLSARRPALRAALGLGPDDVAVLSVGRLVTEKGMETLVSAVATADDPRLALVVAGDGPRREALAGMADRLGVRLRLTGNLSHERLLETYVATDVFALLSSWEPWGVVVNEAAACGMPLVLSNRVGAAADLVVDGENGWLVPAGDVRSTAEVLRRLAAGPAARLAAGARSRALVRGWGYGPSVESFVAAVCEAAGRRPRR